MRYLDAFDVISDSPMPRLYRLLMSLLVFVFAFESLHAQISSGTGPHHLNRMTAQWDAWAERIGVLHYKPRHKNGVIRAPEVTWPMIAEEPE